MKKTITCTICPNGCLIEAEYTCKEDLTLTGYGCKRGIAYSTDECFEPKRTFTSSVKISGADRRMLPVRTDMVIPKDMMLRCAEETHKLSLVAPVGSQQIIAADFLGTGANLIASMTLDKEE